MEEHEHAPDLEKLSIITSLVLLSYATTTFISFPAQTVDLQLPGFLLEINFQYQTIVSFFVALMAAAGSDWLVSTHPNFSARYRWHHWLVPALTAIAISYPLGKLAISAEWWIIFGFGGGFLIAVLAAEYLSVDPYDSRFSFSVISLSAVSLVLFLIIITAIMAASERLYALLVILFPAAFLIAARTLFLRLEGEWKIEWALGISLVINQVAIGLFYFPLKPLQFSMILVGLLYGLITLATNIQDHGLDRKVWIEPAIMIVLFSSMGFLLK